MKYSVVCLFLIILTIGFTYTQAEECKPGDTKKVECNTCFCANGVFACTRKFCVTKREAIAARFNQDLTRNKREGSIAADLKNTPCAPNDYFKIECNTCYCNMDRSGYLCTENICVEGYESLSTSTHIPLTNDSMLIISNDGVQLIENLNSNDNSISRIDALSLKLESDNQTVSNFTDN